EGGRSGGRDGGWVGWIVEGVEGEARVVELLGYVGDRERVAQIRLVGAVFDHRLRVRDQRKFRRHRLAVRKLFEHAAHHRLDRVEHVLLGDETHLKVELVKFAGPAIGARILVAEAGSDLEVAVEARNHDQLLELLRRLRQRVEFPRMQPRRDKIVARALGRGRGQDRRLELEETLFLHAPPDGVDDRTAHHDVAVQPLAAQIEKTVFEPNVLRVFLLAEHWHRQLIGGPEDPHFAYVDIDGARRQVRILGTDGTSAYLAVDAHHPFGAQRLGRLERWRVGVGHHLGDAVMIAQVDEQYSAMVADAVAPAGKPHLLADVICAQDA